MAAKMHSKSECSMGTGFKGICFLGKKKPSVESFIRS